MQKIILTELGIAIYKDDEFVRSIPFKEPAGDYVAVKKGDARLSELAKYLAESDAPATVNDMAVLEILKKKSIDIQLAPQEEIEKIQAAKPEVLVETGLAQDQDDAISKLRDFAIQLSSSKVTEVSQSPDLHITQAINSLDDVDGIANMMIGRLKEWYGLHFPELENIVDSIAGYAHIAASGRRDTLNEKILADAGFPQSKIDMLLLIRDKSRGGDISDANLALVSTLAEQILSLYSLRKKIEEHVEIQMKSIAPNVSAILGAAVGARMIARSGSLKKFALMPASTIQILGAERALFRSLKTGARPPKHGLLFQHPLVHAAPRWQRGKIARAVASKAAIAARVDLHGGELNTVLLDKLNVRIEEIDEKYKDAPPPRQPEPVNNDRYKGPREQSFRRKDGQRPREQSFKRKDGQRSKKSNPKKRKKFGRR